jgi:7-cyano-7-deazaguanine synthase
VKVVAIVSGGLDSVTLAHEIVGDGHELTIVSVDYGQRHRDRELACALACADRLRAAWVPIDLTSLQGTLTGSALTDATVEVPDGHYSDESMRSTIVPNRNMVLLALAGAVAVAQGASVIMTAVHAGDHAVYPDCRPGFIDSLDLALRMGTDQHVRIMAPYVGLTKAEIVKRGVRVGVPWNETWSCYRGEQVHCGTCGTCVERREAFEVAGVIDPTEYRASAA